MKSVDDNGRERYWSKQEILQEFGFPVLSKEIAAKIETLANPTEKIRPFAMPLLPERPGPMVVIRKTAG